MGCGIALHSLGNRGTVRDGDDQTMRRGSVEEGLRCEWSPAVPGHARCSMGGWCDGVLGNPVEGMRIRRGGRAGFRGRRRRVGAVPGWSRSFEEPGLVGGEPFFPRGGLGGEGLDGGTAQSCTGEVGGVHGELDVDGGGEILLVRAEEAVSSWGHEFARFEGCCGEDPGFGVSECAGDGEAGDDGA